MSCIWFETYCLSTAIREVFGIYSGGIKNTKVSGGYSNIPHPGLDKGPTPLEVSEMSSCVDPVCVLFTYLSPELHCLHRWERAPWSELFSPFPWT